MIMLFAFSSCNKNGVAEPEFKLHQGDDLSDWNYEIYSIVIQDVFPVSSQVIVKQKTMEGTLVIPDDYYYEKLISDIPGFDTITAYNFQAVNDKSYYLENRFVVPNPGVRLITQEELNSFREGSDFTIYRENFYKKFPESEGFIGYITFNRIGANDSFDQALVEIDMHKVGIVLWGAIYFLEKIDGSWEISFIIPTWIT